jgi:hypothetical protein
MVKTKSSRVTNMTAQKAYQKCLNEQKRTPELEDIIATDPHYSYRYARYIIKGPFKKGEEFISKNPYYCYQYVCYVIKGSFEKCHPIIFNSNYKDQYINFLKRIKYDLNKISEWLI